MGFEAWSDGEAYRYVDRAVLLIGLLALSVPVGAAAAIRRGKRARRDLLFARIVLWGWVAIFVLFVGYVLTGAWYHENGPGPQVVAAQMTITLLLVFAFVTSIHIGLYVTTREERAGRGARSSAAGP